MTWNGGEAEKEVGRGWFPGPGASGSSKETDSERTSRLESRACCEDELGSQSKLKIEHSSQNLLFSSLLSQS
jgi:hypothetical protein